MLAKLTFIVLESDRLEGELRGVSQHRIGECVNLEIIPNVSDFRWKCYSSQTTDSKKNYVCIIHISERLFVYVYSVRHWYNTQVTKTYRSSIY
jgi:hypothetical protein